jgi:multiple sugar transport system ATP-binding protein
MGDRVAVIRKGQLQQVDGPQELYERPVNLFVAGFIGSPAMNLLEVTLRDDGGTMAVEFGGFRLPIPAEVVASRPALRAHRDRTIVLGIRPEDMEDASLVSDAPADRRIRSTVELREALGSDVVVHIGIDAPPATTEDVKELAVDVGVEALEAVASRQGTRRSNVLARLNPRTTVRKGQPVELVVDTHRLHFFDAADGNGIYDDPPPASGRPPASSPPSDSPPQGDGAT